MARTEASSVSQPCAVSRPPKEKLNPYGEDINHNGIAGYEMILPALQIVVVSAQV